MKLGNVNKANLRDYLKLLTKKYQKKFKTRLITSNENKMKSKNQILFLNDDNRLLLFSIYFFITIPYRSTKYGIYIYLIYCDNHFI